MDLDTRSRENDLISVVRELVRELSPQRLKRGDVSLSSRLDRDLGIDSLARTELVLRIERFLPRPPAGDRSRRNGFRRRPAEGARARSARRMTAHAPDVAVHAALPLIGSRIMRNPDRDARLACRRASGPSACHVLQDENTVSAP